MVDPLEVICSVVAGELLQKIISPLIEKYNNQKDINEKLLQLRQLLITIHAALEAAEGQSISNSWLLRWIRNLEDAACEGGRVLRDWRYRTDEVNSTLVNCSNTFKRIKVATTQFLSCKEATISIDATIKKVEIVAAGTIKFIELLKFQCNQAVVHHPIIMYMSMHNRVIDRIKERKCAIDFLLKPAPYRICSTYLKRIGHRSRAISSIPYGYVLLMCGRKGVGKTTLAQLVYKNEIMKSHFSMVIWVCCRENPSLELAILRALCKKLEFTGCIDKDISHMVYRIAGRLTTERFLLVLDGVSSYPRAVDDMLIILLGSSGAGSKVIITTIYEHLAKRMDGCNILPVELLPMEDLGYLFMENALGGEHPEEYRKLLVIGKEIAETLRGCSPLATKVVSGLLRDNLNEKFWSTVLRHCQQLVAPHSKLKPFILGYKLLPHHLQSCFGIFGTYPRWKFTRGDLISLWVRNGYISNKGRTTSIENIAAECFDDLLRKAFIQPNQVSGLYEVNDMLRDLALYIGPVPLPKIRMPESINKNYSRLIYQSLIEVKL